MKKPFLSNIFPCTSLLCDNCSKICNSEYTYNNIPLVACSEKCCKDFFEKKKKGIPSKLVLTKEIFEEHIEYQRLINDTDLSMIDLSNFGLSDKDGESLKVKAKHLGISNWEVFKGLLLTQESAKSKILEVAMRPKPKIANKKEYKKYGVHITHCCLKHGCKYRDDDCPVELGILQQAYQCEDCQTDNYRDRPFHNKEENL